MSVTTHKLKSKGLDRTQTSTVSKTKTSKILRRNTSCHPITDRQTMNAISCESSLKISQLHTKSRMLIISKERCPYYVGPDQR